MVVHQVGDGVGLVGQELGPGEVDRGVQRGQDVGLFGEHGLAEVGPGLGGRGVPVGGGGVLVDPVIGQGVRIVLGQRAGQRGEGLGERAVVAGQRGHQRGVLGAVLVGVGLVGGVHRGGPADHAEGDVQEPLS